MGLRQTPAIIALMKLAKTALALYGRSLPQSPERSGDLTLEMVPSWGARKSIIAQKTLTKFYSSLPGKTPPLYNPVHLQCAQKRDRRRKRPRWRAMQWRKLPYKKNGPKFRGIRRASIHQ
jgi:hypothetical protein